MRKLLYLFALIAISTACTDKTQGGPAQLELFIEDSPANFQAVNVVIEGIELFGGEKWNKLNYNTQTIPIMNYTGGSSLRLVNQPLDEGKYSKVRFTFATNGNRLTMGGKTKSLAITDAQRVVELPLNIEATSGMVYIMCDMDVAASIDTVKMELNPQLSIMDLNTAGAISGVIATAAGVKIAEQMWVECIDQEARTKSSFTNQTSGKLFVRLNKGDYTVIITPKATSTYLPDTLRNIKVEEAKATMLGAIQLKSKSKE